MTPESRIDERQRFNFEFGMLGRDLGDLDMTSWFWEVEYFYLVPRILFYVHHFIT